MKKVLQNLKEESCHYFSVQEFSENTGQRRVVDLFLNAAIDEISLGANLKENLIIR